MAFGMIWHHGQGSCWVWQWCAYDLENKWPIIETCIFFQQLDLDPNRMRDLFTSQSAAQLSMWARVRVSGTRYMVPGTVRYLAITYTIIEHSFHQQAHVSIVTFCFTSQRSTKDQPNQAKLRWVSVWFVLRLPAPCRPFETGETTVLLLRKSYWPSNEMHSSFAAKNGNLCPCLNSGYLNKW